MPKPTGALDLHEAERGRIVGSKEEGLSNREVARRVGCSPQTVSNIFSRWQANGNTISDRQNCASSRATTQAEDLTIAQMSRDFSKKPVTQILRDLNLGISVM